MTGLSLDCPQLHPLSLLHTRRISWKTKTQYNNYVTLSPSRSKLTHSNNTRNHLYSWYLNLRDHVAYRQQQIDQAHAEQNTSSQDEMTPQDKMVNIFKSLTKVLADNNKQLHSNDVTDPPKFNGLDSHWDDWYLQWRTFLEAKGWLSTAEHATGPGTVGFENEINKKVYNKILSLCQKGTASTYVTKAANFNGWEAAKYLLERYEGFSKQRQRSLRQLVENLRHIHGTNMSRHVDKFERICGQMAHNNPPNPQLRKQDRLVSGLSHRTHL